MKSNIKSNRNYGQNDDTPIPLHNDNQKEYNPQNGAFLAKELIKKIPFADILVDYIDNLEQRKNDELINELNSRLKELELSYQVISERIDKDEHFREIFDYTIIKAKQCNRHKQIEVLIYLFSYYIQNNNISSNDIEIVMDIITSLNAMEEEFFFTILEKNNFHLEATDSIFLNNIFEDKDKPIYISLKNRLISKGIIYERPTELVGESLMLGSEFEVWFTHFGKLLAIILSNYYSPRLK